MLVFRRSRSPPSAVLLRAVSGGRHHRARCARVSTSEARTGRSSKHRTKENRPVRYLYPARARVSPRIESTHSHTFTIIHPSGLANCMHTSGERHHDDDVGCCCCCFASSAEVEPPPRCPCGRLLRDLSAGHRVGCPQPTGAVPVDVYLDPMRCVPGVSKYLGKWVQVLVFMGSCPIF